MSEESLIVKVIGAKLNDDESGMFTSMNPYVKMNYGGDEIKTHTHYEGGQEPIWNKTYDLGAGDKTETLIVFVCDEGTFSDSILGKCSICMDQLKVEGGSDEQYTLLHENEPVGWINISTEYTGAPAEEAPEAAPVEEAPVIAETPPMMPTPQ